MCQAEPFLASSQLALIARSGATSVSPGASTPPWVITRAPSARGFIASGVPVTFVPLYGPANAFVMNERISSRLVRNTPGSIRLPSSVKVSANASASFLAQAATMRPITPCAACWSFADMMISFWRPVFLALILSVQPAAGISCRAQYLGPAMRTRKGAAGLDNCDTGVAKLLSFLPRKEGRCHASSVPPGRRIHDDALPGQPGSSRARKRWHEHGGHAAIRPVDESL